jgi:hypothetical protein
MTNGGKESGGGAKKYNAMAVARTLGISAVMRIFFTISLLLFILSPA